MNSQRLYRAIRKLVRPLRRCLQSPPPPAMASDFQAPTLVLIAHPDDEVFCSGLVCELITNKQEVHLACFTRGEGGDRGESPKEVKLSKVREEELTLASKALGFASLNILDYVDPISSDGQLSQPEHDSAELLAELESLVSKFSITNLITHGSSGEYWHPAHLCLHHHARVLNRRLPQLQLWTFNAWTAQHPLPGVLNQDDPANLSFDATSHHEQRLQSLACHFSQKEIFQRFAKGSLADFISLTAHENYRKW